MKATGVEDEQQFFHADHIGSSGYVTDKNGKVTEHLEYFPYGETWVEEHTGDADTPYQFTGKELDAETGLYYYGARYYNPRTQLWASADPALPDYLDSTGGNEPRDLAAYTYAHNNPLRYTDPTGKFVEEVILAPTIAGGAVGGPPGAAVGAVLGTVVVGVTLFAIFAGPKGGTDRSGSNAHLATPLTDNKMPEAPTTAASPGTVPTPPPAPANQPDDDAIITFYHGTNYYDAQQTAEEQHIDLGRVMKNQERAPGMSGKALYLTQQLETANYYANQASEGGVSGGGRGIIKIDMKVKDFKAFVLAHPEILYNQLIPDSPVAGGTETVIPVDAVPDFERIGRPRYSMMEGWPPHR
ncbi:RHS repeat-associated core domain-containing protein [Streptomyces sp. NPDC097727]|uniref:RHS repeat-associated core domain-containing protein n=1 Tax=Streptomyces sp. NPDC097727 TaxID=3366092 RepID=UPI00381D02EB